MRSIYAAVAIVVFAASSSVAWGYGATGHQTVGAIAETVLTPFTADRVHKELGMTLSEAGPWLDCARDVKPDASGKFIYTPNPKYAAGCARFDTPAEHAALEDYVQRNWDQCKGWTNSQHCHEQYHFADVAIQRDTYDRSDFGTNDHDIVAAIHAAIFVLEHDEPTPPAPKPFDIKNHREALLMLAHLVGDLHQPLHVGSLYLDGNDRPIDPDALTDPTQAQPNAGGNWLDDNGTPLHTEWDAVAASWDPAHLTPEIVTASRRVPTPLDDYHDWAAHWASETIVAARSAFAGATFTHDGLPEHHWRFNVSDHAAYMQAKEATQQRLMVEGGARLAQILNVVWGSYKDPSKVKPQPYLAKGAEHIDAWLAKSPAEDSLVEAGDVSVFFATRALIGTDDRALVASADDVYSPWQVALRFSPAFGSDLTPQTASRLLRLMGRVSTDEDQFLDPMKQAVVDGGRHRPFVDYPNRPGCPLTWPTLRNSGSYPSGHATLGWLWALVLTEIRSERADELFAKGIGFGESRVVCGFHYPSDLQAGRLAASALFDRLHGDKDFRDDLDCAAKEINHVQDPVCTKRDAAAARLKREGEKKLSGQDVPASLHSMN